MTAARDIVCFGLAEWDSLLPTNQHHLCRRLAGGRRVLFVDTVGTRKPRLAPADLVRLVRRLWRGRRPLREVEPNIWRLSALGPAPGLGGWRREWLRRAFARALGGALERLGWRQPVLWFFNARAGFVLGPPAARAFPGGVGPAVYHAVDDLRQVAGADAEEIERAEAFLAARAARVIASAPPLFERLRRLAPNRALHWPNVADFERFHRAADPAAEIPRAITALPRPRIVFAGHLTPSKLDVPLLDRAIERRPLWQWIFIGPVWEGADSEAIRRWARFPNVRLMGAVPYDQLPEWLAGADALIIPYRRDSSAESVCPLKFFEYLATGKPIAATRLPALEPFGGVVPLSEGAEDFLQSLERALAGGAERRREQRLALGRRHSWLNRMREVEKLLAELESP